MTVQTTFHCGNLVSVCQIKFYFAIKTSCVNKLSLHLLLHIHQIFAFAKNGGANKVVPGNISVEDDGDVQMGNSLYSDMIGAKTEKAEDDEMHGKGQISYKDYVNDQEENDDGKNVMVI